MDEIIFISVRCLCRPIQCLAFHPPTLIKIPYKDPPRGKINGPCLNTPPISSKGVYSGDHSEPSPFPSFGEQTRGRSIEYESSFGFAGVVGVLPDGQHCPAYKTIRTKGKPVTVGWSAQGTKRTGRTIRFVKWKAARLDGHGGPFVHFVRGKTINRARPARRRGQSERAK